MSLLKITIKVAILCLLLVLVVSKITTYPVLAQAVSSSNLDLEAQILQIIRKHPEAILESIEEYQHTQEEKGRLAQVKFLQSIKRDSKSSIGESPIQGAVNSKVLLIEFSDFQCPYCAEAHETLKQFVENHQDKVALVYKHYPITQIHSEAVSAATASWAAHQQNKFWQYHDFLFTHQDQLGESLYLQAAKSLGLDLTQFEQDRKSQNAINAIQKDMELAERIGISSTPFFVMNEETFSGAIQGLFLEDKLAKM